MKEFVAEISKQGVVTISVNGIKGSSCTDATKALEAKLGVGVTSEPTGEFYEQEQAQLHSGN